MRVKRGAGSAFWEVSLLLRLQNKVKCGSDRGSELGVKDGQERTLTGEGLG